MKICEKIKRLRQEKGWSQEEVANELGISANAYGSIERGETDVNLARLEEISNVFEIDVTDLFDKKERNVFLFSRFKNNQSHWYIGETSQKVLQLEFELEKQQLLNTEKDKEIALLKRIIELMESKDSETKF